MRPLLVSLVSIQFIIIFITISHLTLATTHHDDDGFFHISGTYKISPNPCEVEKVKGTCMFVWECLKSEGTHLGLCLDGFMFGSCCVHNETTNNVISPPSLPTTSIVTIPLTSSSTTPMTFPQDSFEQVQLQFVPTNSSIDTSRPSLSPDYTTTTTTTSSTPKTIIFHPVQSSTTPRPSTIFIDPQVTTTTVEPEVLEGDVECGRAALHPHQMRIVGGQEASFGLFPWIASIRRTSFFGFSSTHRCGGALLNHNWVATAGHCVDDLISTQIRIRLGEWDFSGTGEKFPHVERTVIKKVVHPAYNFFTYENDLALLKLETPLKYSPHISPICLPTNQDLLIGENATVAGWGRLSENGQLPSRLQHVTVPIMSNARCRELFLKSNRVEHIPDIFLCAGYENGGQDSCQGDSGGPLQIKGRDGQYFLGGVISWGIGCAEPNMPGVCTRISKFTDWILEQVT